MGLFDYIKCEAPLPDADMQEHEFQTKSLDCMMERYVIKSDGRLCLSQKDSEEEVSDYHGDIYFHTFADEARQDWREYRARFTNGRLQDIKRVEENPDEEGGQ